MSKKLFVFLPLLLIFTLLFGSLSYTNDASNNISNKVLRMHVLANSNSIDDQSLKIAVKNNILKSTRELFTDCNNLEESIEIAQSNTELIKASAQEVIKKYNKNYDVKVYVDNEFFDVREYKDFTLPSGNYNTVKVVIGEGKGKNWWCVMYPAVCISACSDDFDKALTKEEKKLITSKKYIPKFKILEIINKIKNKINS
ncbi:stage II sporulation protein R [uncultured Eubacterium sp.]|uniref:stage II sporulation protein R n=1 Tax=uncultured Eubacterium sp. TaxID=165185 RepID=UPI0025D708A5|nr:stage II sporulation protein R [uncultured Eubacterium sp.]